MSIPKYISFEIGLANISKFAIVYHGGVEGGYEFRIGYLFILFKKYDPTKELYE